MTRVEKNNKEYLKNNIIKVLEKILIIMIIYFKYVIIDSIYLMVGTLYIIYLIIKNFDNLIIKAFSKLPRIARASMIYAFIGISIYSILNPRQVVIYKDKIVEVDKELGQTIIETQAKEKPQGEILEYIEPVNKCELSEIECKIYNKAIEIGLTKDQAYILLAISKHETGKWTSNAFNNKHNLGGIMCNTGLKQYNTLDDGIDAFVSLLKNRYFNQGLDTIEKIQPVYCPVGASNDPNNLNQYWLPMVTKYYNEYIK